MFVRRHWGKGKGSGEPKKVTEESPFLQSKENADEFVSYLSHTTKHFWLRCELVEDFTFFYRTLFTEHEVFPYSLYMILSKVLGMTKNTIHTHVLLKERPLRKVPLSPMVNPMQTGWGGKCPR